MDPNEALRLIRAYIKQMRVESMAGATANFTQHARDLAETVEGLDEWLSKDGFLPNDWQADDADVVEKKVAIVNALLELPWGEDEDISGGDLVETLGGLLEHAGLIEEAPFVPTPRKPGDACDYGAKYGYPAGYVVHRRWGDDADCDEHPDGTITDARGRVVGNLNDR